jgi:hypothetical protein
MTVRNITPTTMYVAPRQRGQGAVIQSVAHIQEYKAHYGVQSATFVQTVFPGQATGTYRLNGMIPHWQGPQITAAPGTTAPSKTVFHGNASSPPVPYRAAGSPPVPYPPPNASAYYSSPPKRIVPNPCHVCYNAYG